MKIRALGWSGFELESGGESLVIDYIKTLSAQFAKVGNPLVSPERPGKAVAGLITHLHDDHAEVSALEEALAPEAPVLRPGSFVGHPTDMAFTAAPERELAASKLDVRVVAEWEEVEVGPFKIGVTPATDGVGELQVNFVVEAGGARVFHGGDTVFHGFWWRTVRQFGPVDVAIMPINGSMANLPAVQPTSEYPMTLTPEQAVQAAVILGAKVIIPMHYGRANPPVYIEQTNPIPRLQAAADRFGLRVVELESGQSIQYPAGADSEAK